MRLKILFSLFLLLLLNACSSANGTPAQLSGTLVYVSDSSLYRFDPDTGKSTVIEGAEKFLAAEDTGTYLALSPDRRHLAFSGIDPVYGCSTFHPEQPCSLQGLSGIFLADIQTNLVTLIAPYALDEISWSPSGGQFIYASPDFLEIPYRTYLKISTPQGGEPILLTSGEHVDTHPAWSPTGEWIAFLREPSPTPDQPECKTASTAYNTCVDPGLYLIHPDGSGLVRLMEHVHVLNSAYNAPVWSPDGKMLAVVSGENAAELTLVEIPSGKLTAVDTGLPVTEIAGWSPDGNHLLFSSGEKGQQHVSILNENTLEVIFISRNKSNDTHPAWSPNGKAVAYLSQKGTGARSLRIHFPGREVQDDLVFGKISPHTRFLWVDWK